MRKLIAGFGAALMLLITPMSAFASFSDVNSDDFYYKAVNFLEEKGIVVGYADGTFGYNLNINRAEFMKLVMEASIYGYESQGLLSYNDQSCFSDVPANQWFTAYICYAKEQGWVVGYPDGTFRPAKSINFVSAMKIVLEVFGEEYLVEEPWYRGIVDKASSLNIIPLTIDGFDHLLTRAEMADMVTRVIKDNLGELDAYLGGYSDMRATYESIKDGTTSENVPLLVFDDTFDPWVFDGVERITGYEDLDTGEFYDVGSNFDNIFNSENGERSVFVGTPGMIVLDSGEKFFSVYSYSSVESTDATSSDFYKYYSDTDDISLVFRYVSSSNDMNAEVPYLRLVAYDRLNNDLIVQMFPSVDFSPGPCFMNWLGDVNTYYSIDLDLPISERTLQSFVVPQTLIESDQQAEDECVASL